VVRARDVEVRLIVGIFFARLSSVVKRREDYRPVGDLLWMMWAFRAE